VGCDVRILFSLTFPLGFRPFHGITAFALSLERLSGTEA
jgi:hypothetical protein